MAKIKIDIVANYKDASQGIGNVKKGLKSLRETIVDSQGDTSKLTTAEQNYNNAINKQLGLIENLNGEKSSLEKSLKLLKTEQYEFNSALGEGNKYSKSYQVAIESTEAELAKYKKTTDNATQSSSDHSLKLLEITKNIIKFQLVLAPIRKAMQFVSRTISESITVAAEAEQVFNKLATVFEGVESSANSMAQSLANSLGVSNSTSASALATVADMLQAQGMGATESLEKASEWVSKFQDIIAFKDINMDLSEFATNFMSGATGNLRNFRTFGSIVKESAVNAELAKEGLSDLSDEEEELAKMVTRAELALEQQANAMGATQSEWDTTLSISTRLNEQWKQWKENLGATINEGLNPIKKWLTEILSIANKVTEAASEIKSGEFTIKTEAVASGDELQKIVKRTLGSLLHTSTEGVDEIARINAISGGNRTKKTYTQDMFLTASGISDLARATGATISEIAVALEEIGYDVSEDVYTKAQNIYETEIERLEHKNKQDKQLAKLQESAIQDYQDSVRAMFGNDNSLASWLSGNSFVDKTSADYLVGGNTGTMGENVDTAISDLSEALSYINNYLPTIKNELSGLYDQYGVAFEDLRNAEANGWSEEEIATQKTLIDTILQQISVYAQTIDQWEEYQKTLSENLADLYTRSAKDAALTSVTSATTDLSNTIAKNQKQKELEEKYTGRLSFLVDIYMQAYEYQQQYNDLLQTLIDAGYTESEATEQLADYKKKYGEIIEQQIKDEDAEWLKNNKRIVDEFNGKYNADNGSAWQGADSSYYASINSALKENIETITNYAEEKFESGDISERQYNQMITLGTEYAQLAAEQQKEELRLNSIFESLGDIGNIVNTIRQWTPENIQEFRDAEGSDKLNTVIGGDIYSLILNIVSQLEVVQKLSSFVGDYIVPILDAFLEPLLPLIETIGGLVQSLIQGLLAPLFPIIVEISAVLTLIVGTVKAGIDFVVNSIKWAIGNLAKSVLKAIDGLIWGDQSGWYDSSTWVGQWAASDPVKAFQQTMDETLDAVRTIRGTTFDIKENTEGEDLSFLNELLKAGIITESQYNERAKVKQSGLYWDTVKTDRTNYMDWSNTGSSVRYGNVTVNISGGDQAEVKRTILRAFSEAGISVQGASFGEAS